MALYAQPRGFAETQAFPITRAQPVTDNKHGRIRRCSHQQDIPARTGFCPRRFAPFLTAALALLPQDPVHAVAVAGAVEEHDVCWQAVSPRAPRLLRFGRWGFGVHPPLLGRKHGTTR